MAKIFVDPSAVGEEYIRIDEKDVVHHLARVLRIKKGEKLEISDGLKWEYKTDVEEISEREILCKITDKQAHASEPEVRVTLFQGFPKASKMELIIQKCVELGIDTVVPVYMDRSVVVDKGKDSKKAERWQKIADEASSQCRRGRLTNVKLPLKFADILPLADEFDLFLFPYENEDGYSIKDALTEFKKKGIKDAKIAMIIGPEGGFSDKEADKLRKIEVRPVSLGKTILRTETAGMAALAMIMYEMEL